MRRESQPNGHGTKLLLNVALFPELMFVRTSDNMLQFTAVSAGDGDDSGAALSSYLVKVGRGGIGIDKMEARINEYKSSLRPKVPAAAH